MIINNRSAYMYQIMKNRHRQIIRKAMDPVAGLLSNQSNDEDFRMTETRIYVGLNDSKTRVQEAGTDELLAKLKNVCKSYHVAFSVDIEEGGYYHEDGEYTEETTFVLVLIDTNQDIARNIAKDLCALFHQESVLITETVINGSFIMGEND